MDEDYGITKPAAHHDTPHRRPARYLVLIETGGSAIARLFLDTREPAGEFDASTEEVSEMTQGLVPERSAAASEWDQALAGHSAAERAAAEVFTLDI
jgi:hypothetical protein